MMASEVSEKLAELVNEYGDFPVKTPDPIEGMWLNEITTVEFHGDRDAMVVAAED